jgi:hypothetical protein
MAVQPTKNSEIELLALSRRSGWPDDLRVLITRYPREQWHSHVNLGETVRFWLSRHAMFRELAVMLETIMNAFHAGTLGPDELSRQLAPRLQFLLSQLNVHHQIEDFHYFPIFRSADPPIRDWSVVSSFWTKIITQFMPTWRLLRIRPMQCLKRLRPAATQCGAAATITREQASY